MTELTPPDEPGAPGMMDISAKDTAEREACAEAMAVLSEEAFEAISSGETPDVLAAARIAGIMAAKKTPELIPLCFAVPLSKVEISFEMVPGKSAVRITATARTAARTGAEMVALTAASIAALTICDMTKASDQIATIESVRLIAKPSGKSAAYAPPPIRAVRKPVSTAAARGRPTALLGEVAAPAIASTGALADAKRAALRNFMTSNRLRATEWAKQAGIPASQLYAFLTGRLRSLPDEAIQKLARAARVRPEDMFR
jgi:cyclic pyranopterin monophosphate synthase